MTRICILAMALCGCVDDDLTEAIAGWKEAQTLMRARIKVLEARRAEVAAAPSSMRVYTPAERADLLAASDAYAQGVGRLDAQLAASQAAVDAAMKSGKRMVAHHAIARAVVEFEHAAARLEELASRKSKTGTTRMLKFED